MNHMYTGKSERSTLVVDDIKTNQYMPASSPGTPKQSPTSSMTFLYNLPVRHHSTGGTSSLNNNDNEKDQKRKLSPPELMPKPAKSDATMDKLSLMNSTHKNIPANKENNMSPLPSPKPAVLPKPSQQSSEPTQHLPVQRPKTRIGKKKMTEEEAVKELG